MPSITRETTQKHYQVIGDLRRRIVAGQFRPGDRLPAWSQLSATYGVARPTLTRVMDRLKRDGLVFSDSTRGTFVMPRPPHLHRYAVAFEASPDGTDWTRFLATLAAEVQRIDAADPGRDLSVLYGVNEHAEGEAVDRLRRDLRDGLLAGVITISAREAAELPMPEMAGGLVPCAVIRNGPVPGVPTVGVDYKDFLHRSLSTVAEVGCSSVALISNDNGSVRGYMDLVEAHGLTAKPYWFHQISEKRRQMATNVAQLLLDRPAADRPDALVVTDDNLVDAVLAGVVDSGLRVPQDLFMITHCNWPSPVESIVPTRRLGFSVNAILDTCFQRLEAQRRGESYPGFTRVPALFHTESL